MKRRKNLAAIDPRALRAEAELDISTPTMRVEKRQTKLAANAEAIDRWQRRLFRAATELKKLTEQRKRLLNPPGRKLKYHGEVLTGIGGGAVDELNDDVPIL